MPYIKVGETAHWVVFRNSEDGTPGLDAATEVLANVEADHNWLASFWTGVTWKGGTTSATKPGLFAIISDQGGATWGGGYNSGTNDGPWAVKTFGPDATEMRSGFIAEVTEEWSAMQNKGYATPPTEGSNGESLSQFFMQKWYLHVGKPVVTGGWNMQDWLNGAREDGVNYSYGGDYMPHAGEVISGVVFLNYLNTELGYTINQIIAAAAPTFTGVYKKLTGRTDNPFLHFLQLLETKYPHDHWVDLSGVNDQNNPWPINTAALKVFHKGAWVLPGVLGEDPPPSGTPPTAAFSISRQQLTVTLDASFSKPGSAAITSYAWDLGDSSNDFGSIIDHTYAAAGTYTVKLVVTDDAGLTAPRTQTVTLTAAPAPPKAEFTWTITGLTIAFDSAPSTPGTGTITGYAWDFGDGSKGSGPTPSHTYAGAMTVNVTLTVTNSAGQSASRTWNGFQLSVRNAGYDYFAPANPDPLKSKVTLDPGGLTVAQALVHHEATDEYWITQVTANSDTASTYTESTRVSRMDSTGKFLGQMVLKGAGHGFTLNVEYRGTQPYLWVNWEEPASGSTRTFDIVRLPFSNTGGATNQQDRDSIADLDVMIAGSGSARVLAIDWKAERVALSTFGSCTLYNLSDVLGRGTLYPIKTVSTPYTSTYTWQGLCTYNDALFVMFARQKNDGDTDEQSPWEIREYSWNTGQKLRTLSIADVGRLTSNTWVGGRGECEGLCVYNPGDGSNPQMQLVDVTGVSQAHHWDIWNIDVKTQIEAAGTAGFILRTTKPTTANVGAGKLRPVTNVVTPPAGVYTVTTANAIIKDTTIKGTVVVKAPGVIFENCEITGPPTDPGNATSQPGTVIYIVNTDDPACAVSPPKFSYCSVYQRFNSPIVNAFSNRYVTVEYSDISNVVRAFTPTPESGATDCKVTVRGSLIRDFVFYAGAGSGNPVDSSLNTLSGNVVNGAYKAMAWTHCAAFKIDTDTATGVNIYGNNIVALWSRSSAISMMPLPYDNNNDVVAKDVSAFVLNGGRNLIVEDNWLDGGGPTVSNPDTTVTASFARNRFGRLMDKPLGLTGTTATDDAKYQGIVAGTNIVIYETDTANRNIWEDTHNVVNRVTTVTPPPPPPPPPPPGGTQPTGPGISRYQDLAGATFNAKVNAAPTTNSVSFASGTFEFSDFAIGTSPNLYGVVYPGKGLLGSGSAYTVIRMKASTSTKASLVPAQSTGSTDPLYLIRATSTTSGVKYDGFHLQGTTQGHIYHGLRISSQVSPIVSNCKFSAIPGNKDTPPGETFHIDIAHTSNISVSKVVMDGASTGASGFGPNSSSGGTYTDCEVYGMKYCKAIALWQHTGGATFTRFNAHDNAFAYGFEQCSGTFTLNSCTFGAATRADIHLANNGLYGTGATAKLVINDPILPTGKTTIKVLLSVNEIGQPNKQTRADVKVFVKGVDKSSTMLTFVTSA